MSFSQLRGQQIVDGSINEAQLDVATINLFKLFLQGRDPLKHKEEYMTEINRLSYVKSNFDKILAYKQMERLFKNAKPRKIKRNNYNNRNNRKRN